MEIMINKKKAILFSIVTILEIIVGIFGIYLTYIIPRPDTIKAIINMFLNNSQGYQLTICVVFIGGILSIFSVIIGVIIISEIRDENYYLSSDEEFIEVKSHIKWWILFIIICSIVMSLYFIWYIILLAIPAFLVCGAVYIILSNNEK